MKKVDFKAWDTEKEVFTNFMIVDNVLKFMDKFTGVWFRDDEQKRFKLLQNTESMQLGWKNGGGRMKLQVKFDFIHNMEKQMENAVEEELKLYKENPEEFFKKSIERLKKEFKDELNNDDYCWIENLEVKVVEK